MEIPENKFFKGKKLKKYNWLLEQSADFEAADKEEEMLKYLEPSQILKIFRKMKEKQK